MTSKFCHPRQRSITFFLFVPLMIGLSGFAVPNPANAEDSSDSAAEDSTGSEKTQAESPLEGPEVDDSSGDSGSKDSIQITEPSDETWFLDESPTAGMNSEGQNLSGEAQRSRLVDFDAGAALHALVAESDLKSGDLAERTVVSSAESFDFQAFDGEIRHINIREVAVMAPLDGGSQPVVEVLGDESVGGGNTSLASFVFSPDDAGEYQLSASINSTGEDSIRVEATGETLYQIDEVSSNTPGVERTFVDDDAPPKDGELELDAPEYEDNGVPLVPGSAAYKAAKAPNYEVTVLAVAANGIGGAAVAEGQMRGLIGEANAAFEYSGIRTRLRLLGAMGVSFSQNLWDMGEDLKALDRGKGVFANVHSRRNELGADIVSMIVPTSSTKDNYSYTCGVAWRAGQGKYNKNIGQLAYDASYGFNVVATQDAIRGGVQCPHFAFAHEVGHNLGANHDPDHSNVTYGDEGYIHGYAVPGAARDIMSYQCNWNTPCAESQQFASPWKTFRGYPNFVSGNTWQSNAARMIEETSTVASEWRTTTVGYDVPTSHKFRKEIMWLVNRKISSGYADGSFRPGESISREAMSAFLFRMRKVRNFKVPATAKTFSDVPKSQRFYTYIMWMSSEKITTGNADGTFKPKDAVSREAMAAFLYRYAGSPTFTPTAAPFSDVPKTHKFYKQIAWLKSVGITTGNADGTFGPSNAVSREAMAAFLYRYNAKGLK
ncbi:hypothetical protein G7068_07605 [Leucobacter viscericola]|uniref:SLH domain-containing protein n=1 Tax=Leucobacter viscericola TaxID=2714935 RepID=A0A6G7XFC3_9MICO|nr:S-layer homology domain-containing protein [Leucobacter viscericola]QIK63078.1 hypothetical protein G7068_07605 [Leucobacter viscericola]